MANQDVFEGKWKQLKGKARQQWSKLSEDEVQQVQGNREELEGRLQERYGWTKEEARQEVDRWLAENG